MLIKHNEKAADASHMTKGNGGKGNQKGPDAADRTVVVKERELAELRRFVQEQVERYNADRHRLERELADSKRNVRQLISQIEQFKQLLLDSPLRGADLKQVPHGFEEDDPVEAEPPPAKAIPARRQVPIPEPIPEKGSKTAAFDQPDDGSVEVVPPAPHLLTTEALFYRAVGADEVPESTNFTALALGVLACVVIGATFLLLYWEPFADQLSRALLSLLGEKGS
ncbi:MAG: hypothetical protein U1D30_21435 [Planctomycetota bacterium]